MRNPCLGGGTCPSSPSPPHPGRALPHTPWFMVLGVMGTLCVWETQWLTVSVSDHRICEVPGSDSAFLLLLHIFLSPHLLPSSQHLAGFIFVLWVHPFLLDRLVYFHSLHFYNALSMRFSKWVYVLVKRSGMMIRLPLGVDNCCSVIQKSMLFPLLWCILSFKVLGFCCVLFFMQP